MNLVNWEEMKEGDKLVFRGYSDSSHDHWSFNVGKVYTVGYNLDRGVGPISDNGQIPSCNWGFMFEKVAPEVAPEEIDFSTLKKGDKLVFRDYTGSSIGFHYTVGKIYKVDEDGMGPPSDDGIRPWENYGFLFERVAGDVKESLQESHKDHTVNTLTRHLRT